MRLLAVFTIYTIMEDAKKPINEQMPRELFIAIGRYYF